MGTPNEEARARALRLIGFGITQRRIADEMGEDPSWVNKWMKESSTSRVGADEADRLMKFERSIAAVLAESYDEIALTARRFTPLQAYLVSLMGTIPREREGETYWTSMT